MCTFRWESDSTRMTNYFMTNNYMYYFRRESESTRMTLP